MTVRDTHASQILITQKLKILKNQRLMMMLIPGANVTGNVRKMMNAASGTGSTQHQLENVNSLQGRPAVRKVAMKSTPHPDPDLLVVCASSWSRAPLVL